MVFSLLLLPNMHKSKRKLKAHFIFLTSHPLIFQKVMIFKKALELNPRNWHDKDIVNLVPNPVGLTLLYAVKRPSEKADLRHEKLKRRTDMRPIPRERGRRTRKYT